jgi:hypothetical protein
VDGTGNGPICRGLVVVAFELELELGADELGTATVGIVSPPRLNEPADMLATVACTLADAASTTALDVVVGASPLIGM